MGYPILNDTLYGGRFIGNILLDEIQLKISSEPQKKIKYDIEIDMEKVNEYCKTKPMEIYLHSKRYKFKDLSFESNDPYWVKKEIDINS